VKTLQEISDRMEIDELLVDYCYAIDTHSWDDLDAVFTPDAFIDYSATGGESGDLAAIKVFLSDALDLFAGHQHLIATSKIVITGDEATGRTVCHNPLILTGEAGVQQVVLCGLWYHDTFIRTPDGWRMSSRRQERSYMAMLKS